MVPCWGADSVSIIEVNYENPGEIEETSRIYLNKDAKPYHTFSYANSEHIYPANTHRHTVSEINLLDMKITNKISTGYGSRTVICRSKRHYTYMLVVRPQILSVLLILLPKRK